MTRRRISITVDCDDETCSPCQWKKATSLKIDHCYLFNIRLVIDGIEDDGTENERPLRTMRCDECLERDEGRID
jgi:hypothetical protein